MAVNAALRKIDALLGFAVRQGLLDRGDYRWAYNTLLDVLHLDGCRVVEPTDDQLDFAPAKRANSLDELVRDLFAEACERGRCQQSAAEEEHFFALVTGIIMPRPSQVKARFSELLAMKGSKDACAYLYNLCCQSGYIRTEATARNLKWISPSRWGDLEITINLSKPEKDPRDIAKLSAAVPAEQGSFEAYPACQLCFENEGYAGRLPGDAHGTHPARQNLRIAWASLGQERWGFQYSPYAYYSEHCIVINPQHVPMHIDATTFRRLLDFVDTFPQYFIGSNADLPIVGGSILNHDHFQAGAHEFPMDKAPVVQRFELSAFPQVECGVVQWPVSVLRLQAASREDLAAAADCILQKWRTYSDESVGIVAQTLEDGKPVRHNTITPIAHKTAEGYQLDLALRCNITSEEHPLGVFHPHAELHHVKKENIGLIEVMGLAILPPRLKGELDAGTLTQDEIGKVFAQVLEHAGVFKWDESGRAALTRFLATL